MATQHPDNASAAYWNNKKFISAADEIEECYRVFKEMGCTEYMWDWEGKFVDEAVIERFFQQYYEFFKTHPLGKDVFLTFRIPNVDEESGFRLARAYMSILTAADLADQLKFHNPPIFEVILPMTKSAEQLMNIHRTFNQVAHFKREVFKTKHDHAQSIHVIPLFEEVRDLCHADEVLEEYFNLYKKEFGRAPEYLRPFIARSDPALNAGIIPAVLSSKVAIQKFHKLGEKYNVPMFPVIGTGSLPFRGGVNPENIQETIAEYSGIRTMTIQSAFRYDYPPAQVKNAIELIEKTLPELAFAELNKKEIKDIEAMNRLFGDLYKATVEAIAETINRIAYEVPGRRERMLHIGLFGYSRGVGKVRLPRAISFTAAMYSLGVPPEFIATGRGIQEAGRKGFLPTLEKRYLNLRADLVHAGKYLNKENLSLLAKDSSAFAEIERDVHLLEDYLGEELGPKKTKHFLHRNLVSSIYLLSREGENLSEELEKAAIIRRSLG